MTFKNQDHDFNKNGWKETYIYIYIQIRTLFENIFEHLKLNFASLRQEIHLKLVGYIYTQNIKNSKYRPFIISCTSIITLSEIDTLP